MGINSLTILNLSHYVEILSEAEYQIPEMGAASSII